jgi:hypothetical protein
MNSLDLFVLLRGRRGWGRSASGAALVLLLVTHCVTTLAAQELPLGLDKARFGMSLAELEKLYPGLQVAARPATPSAGDLATTVAELASASVEPFGTCSLHFTLLNDKLYQVQARCQTPPEVLEERLVKRFGVAHFKREEPVIWYWRNTATTLTYSRSERQISVADNAWAGALFQRALRGGASAAAPATHPSTQESNDATLEKPGSKE